MPRTLADRISNRLALSFPRRRMTVSAKRPIVSFTFDDAPQSALSNGARILEQYGARGTFYIAGGLVGREHDGQKMMTAAECRDLARRGHEIGNHTFSHRKAAELGRHFAADIERNDAYLATVIEGRATNYAAPYGLSSPRAQQVLAERFRSARGIHAGINRGITDVDNLSAIDIRPGRDEAQLLGWTDEVAASPGWLIYFTHDVKDDPSPYGCRPAVFERIVAHAVAKGCDVLTIDAALDQLGVAP